VACAFAVGLKFRLGFDDSLDVVGVHLVGGLIGVLAIGFLGTTGTRTAGATDALFAGGGLDQLWRQAVAAGAVGLYSFVVTALLGLVIEATIGFRLSPKEEETGVDETEHAESAYDLCGTVGARTGRSRAPARRGVARACDPTGTAGGRECEPSHSAAPRDSRSADVQPP